MGKSAKYVFDVYHRKAFIFVFVEPKGMGFIKSYLFLYVYFLK
jgi:hypothetical protein